MSWLPTCETALAASSAVSGVRFEREGSAVNGRPPGPVSLAEPAGAELGPVPGEAADENRPAEGGVCLTHAGAAAWRYI